MGIKIMDLIFFFEILKENERAIILRLGRIMSSGAKGPGLFFVLPCIDEIHEVDLSTVVVDVTFFYVGLVDRLHLRKRLRNRLKNLTDF
jgi:regulator of protease activity HflC (stomatin/prohibitin superfamily)